MITLKIVYLIFSYHSCYILTEYLCYDDGCHLARYANNPIRRDLTDWTKMISQLKIVVDKMHFSGHTDKWCREVCDPHKCRDLDKVLLNCINL